MTFPPCFSSSFSSRASGVTGISASHGDALYHTIHRHQQQQSRLFSTATATPPSTSVLQHKIPPMPSSSFEPRSATPDHVLPEEEECHQQDSSRSEQAMEDNAALMLLELSKIVTKEISADSGCITSSSEEVLPSSPARSIPKSIEIRSAASTSHHNRDHSWGSESSQEMQRELSPHVVLAAAPQTLPTRSFSFQSSNITGGSSFEIFGRNSAVEETIEAANRFRTVSLVGDEMVPVGHRINNSQQQVAREVSPLLLPLSSPLSKDSKFESPQRPRTLTTQHPLFIDPKNLSSEAIRRALVGAGAGAKALSEALVASQAAAVITPVPEQPRPILSFANSHTMVEDPPAGIHFRDTEDSQRGLPLELPPLLLHPKKTASSNSSSIEPTTSGLYPKISKRASIAALPTKAKAAAGSKKQVTVKKKKSARSAKKPKPQQQQQPRQKHTGKKFSWKAYPELERFLIVNREEYLSFSAKNYTIEQRDYNNRLTSRLLEHANASGYSTLFESCAFSSVRDRIRSYYKSYVQSFKRRKERQEQQERQRMLELE